MGPIILAAMRLSAPGVGGSWIVPEPPFEQVTEFLRQWKSGDREALNALVPLIYKELHGLAHHYLRGERSEHTLQTTALVNEAYLRLANQGPFQIENRGHFVAVAARLMRQILVDYARTHRAAKRGADCRVELDEEIDIAQNRSADVVALDDALTELARLDAQQALIVELRFFGGLTVEETAAVLEVSVASTKRDWAMARAWLSREIRKGGDGNRATMGQN